jgi:uncharacterized protein (TIGR03083 family)
MRWRHFLVESCSDGLSYSIMLPAEIYCDARSRFVELVRSLPEEMHDRWVPACPQWSVRDIVAHLAGASADFIESNFPAPGVPFECWTATQVAKRESRSFEELLAEWDHSATTIVTMLGDGRVPDGPLINDVATHEQDVRGALEKPGGQDAPGYAFALNRFLGGLENKILQAELPAMALHTEEWNRNAGSGEPEVTVTASAFEIARALAGRRSRAQIAAFDWQGDAARYHRLIPMMGPSKFDLVEKS